MNEVVDLGEEFTEEGTSDTPPEGTRNWVAGAKGYSITKLGMMAESVGTSPDPVTRDMIGSSMVTIHDYTVLGHRLYIDRDVDVWGLVHRYPRFWTAEPVHSGLRAIDRRAPDTYGLRPTASQVRERFERDREAWQVKSAAMSSLMEMVTLPEYQRIIGLGPDAVPLIIESLRTEVDHWFWALVSILGEDHGAGAETLAEAAQKWISWFDNLPTRG